MDNGFIDILKQLVSEQTCAALIDAKRCGNFLADYTKNEYIKESRLLVQAVEAGVVKSIGEASADGLAACKKAQIMELEEGYDINPASAANIVNALALVLRGDTAVAVSPSVEKAVEKPVTAVARPAVVAEKYSTTTFAQGPIFTDPRDGQVYRTIKVGGLIWMAGNLNYRAEGSWCYDNDELSGKKYGRLYTWNAAMAAIPKGWRLPSRGEWDDLVEAAGNELVAGKKLKSKIGWSDREDGTSGTGTDEFGFSALPGGCRADSFFGADYAGHWWSATERDVGSAYYRYMYSKCDCVYEASLAKSNGFSARCVAPNFFKKSA